MKVKAVMDIAKESQSTNLSPGPLVRNLPFYLQAIGSFYARRNYLTERDGYASFLLLYTLAGCGQIETQEGTCLLPVNHVVLFDCRKPHRYITFQAGSDVPSQKYKSANEQLDPKPNDGIWNFCYVHLDGSGVSAYEAMLNIHKLQALHLTDDGRNQMLNQLTTLFDESADLTTPRMEIAVNQSVLLQRMLSNLLLMQENYGQVKQSYNSVQIINQSLDWMTDHYAEHISLDQLARQANLSKFHFSRLFHTQTSLSPYEWLLNYRINQSKQLLRHSCLPVQQVARNSGYGDVNHFIRAFRRQTGTTPLRYRKENWLL